AVLGEVDRVVRRPEDAEPGALDRARQPERGLAAELDADADRALALEDGEHGLLVERLEVEAVARVVVGRHGLGVAVDHHRLESLRAEAARGVDAAVVELDSLADPVRAAAEDDDAAPRLRRLLVALAARRVEVARRGRDLPGARVDTSERDAPGGGRHGPSTGLELAGEPGMEVLRAPVRVDLQSTSSLRERLREGAADAHRLADRLHLR